MPLDTAPGCLVLARFAEAAAGEDDRYPGASDDEIAGVIAAWARVKAYVSSREHAAAAGLVRRRPARGCAPGGPGRMPGAADEVAAGGLPAVAVATRALTGDMV